MKIRASAAVVKLYFQNGKKETAGEAKKEWEFGKHRVESKRRSIRGRVSREIYVIY